MTSGKAKAKTCCTAWIKGEWSRSARVIIDDARVHEVRILNLNDPRTGTIRIEKLVENDRCVLIAAGTQRHISKYASALRRCAA